MIVYRGKLKEKHLGKQANLHFRKTVKERSSSELRAGRFRATFENTWVSWFNKISPSICVMKN